MIFKRLEVENFGPFKGKLCLNLDINNTSNDSRPLVIIGGKNGTGKTTLFEAIKICLYGRFFKGRKLPSQTYTKYINQKFYRYADGEPAKYASVAVEFDYAKLGHVNNYFVRRSWKRLSSRFVEELRIEQNGKVLDDIDEDQWQDFLMELLPPRISKFFFFDGEHIQKLAKERNENEYILTSINSLLGIDIVERLRSDIKIYASRKVKTINNKIELRIQEYEKRKKLLENKLNLTLEKQELLRKKINQFQMAIEDQEIKIAMEGGSFASKREKLKAQKKSIDEEIENIKDQIRDLCSNLLPFAYAPDLCQALRKRLVEEEKEQQKSAAINFLNRALDELMQGIELSSLWDSLRISPEDRSKAVRIILSELKNKIELANNSCKEIIHPISSIERDEMLKWIELALNDVPLRLMQLSSRLEKLVRTRQRIEKILFSVPSDDVMHPLIRRLGELHEKIGKYQEKLYSLEEKERQIKNELNHVTRELKKSIDEKIKNENIKERLALVEKAQNALEEYLTVLREEKVAEFSQNLLQCFNLLFNKKYFIQKVNVDPLTFNVNLVDSDGILIPANTLSAGERQIYAVSLCWALARSSGRPIPFIIDTPLGRLDEEHRRNILERFFSNASHQVIIFSTD
ncbi:MAG: DNA sulfur modification protein DndD, partial [Fervidobacterium sp.]